MRALRTSCERTARLVSLSLDGELSEVEERLLRRHLAACPGCRSFAATASAVTGELRAEPLVALRTPVTLPRSPRARIRTLLIGPVAATVAAATLTSLLTFGGSGQPVRTPALEPGADRAPARPLLPTSLDTFSQRQLSLEIARQSHVVARVPGPQLR
jgi:anti-sigma factor RsiW